MDMQKFESTASMVKAKHLMGVGKDTDISDPTRDLKANPKGVYAELSVDERNDMAMNQINQKLLSETSKINKFIHDAKAMQSYHAEVAAEKAAEAMKAASEALVARSEAAAARAEAAADRAEAAATRMEAAVAAMEAANQK